MRAPRLIVALAAFATVVVAAAVTLRPRPPPSPLSPAQLRAEPLEPRFEALKPIRPPAPPVLPGDWLALNPEPGETFGAYVDAGPTRATPERRVLYFQPLGAFTPEQLRVLDQTADYVARFYQLPVRTLPTLPTAAVTHRGKQLLTTDILARVLIPARPADALAVLALTSEDLYPAPDWNFVLGEASTVDRVGVWSLFRNGTPGTPEYLMRTLKTATHELGHMLSLQHCVAWSCVMAGSNSVQEADLQPASLCPACLQKVTWNVGLDPVKRFDALAEFYADAGFTEELAMTRRELAASGAR